MKRIGLLIFCIVEFIAVGIYISTVNSNTVKTDSGWDSDYGGSSWSSSDYSSSDWGGSSSYDWDYDYDHNYSHGGSSSSSSSRSNVDGMVVILFMIIFAIIVVKNLSISTYKNNKKYSTTTWHHDDELKGTFINAPVDIKKYFPNISLEQLIDQLYKIFVDIQEAWMEFDYDKLKTLCSDELYESYKSDLEVLQKRKGKNIMSDFQIKNARITNITEKDGLISIRMFLLVSFIDYVINTETNEVIKGNKNTFMHNNYNLEFIAKKSNNGLICASCGAKLEAGEKECAYCHTPVNNNYGSIVLNKKSRI